MEKFSNTDLIFMKFDFNYLITFHAIFKGFVWYFYKIKPDLLILQFYHTPFIHETIIMLEFLKRFM